jgi:hypothetical protein
MKARNGARPLQRLHQEGRGREFFTSVELEGRNVGRPDAVWDDAGKRLYVLGSHGTSSMFWLVDYDDVTDALQHQSGGRRG